MTDPEKPKSLYLAFTPYHLLLTLIHQDRNENDFVIMVDDHGKLKDYEAAGSKLFKNFFFVSMAAGSSKILSRQLRFPVGNRRKIDSIIKHCISEGVGDTYIFNDAIPAAQYIMRKMRKKAIYVEDGSAPYNDHYISWSLPHKLKCWLAYGLRYQFVKVLGTSSLVRESRFLSPALVRAENKLKPYQNLTVGADYLAAMRRMGLALPICKEVSLHTKSTAVLILLPRLAGGHADFVEKLRYLITQLDDRRLALYLKSHPLDGNVYENLGLREGHGILLPSEMPAELAPVIINRLKVVIGKETTSLLAIGCLFPELKIINLIEPFAAPSQYQVAMRKAGIDMREPDELSRIL